MGILGDAISRRRRGAPERSAYGESIAADPPPAAAGAVTGEQPAREAREQARGSDGRSELARRRDSLAEQVAELHWDLGGLTYEMAIRDHFRLDVLVARAAALQERDAELAEVERLLALQEAAAAGSCPSCSAPHSRGAMFCWQCGATLMERAPSVASPVGPAAAVEAPTALMDALLAGTRGAGGPAHPTVPAEE